MKSQYNHPLLGEITVNRSSRARRVSVSVRPSGVTLTLPRRYPLEEGMAFAESKREWIDRARRRTASKVKPPLIIVPPFHTRMHELELRRGEQAGMVVRGDRILVSLPQNWAAEEPSAQELIRKAVIEALRREAKVLLPERVARLAAQFGFSYNGLSFRNAVSRWGSCSARNSISLSIHLMLLPDVLIDYVILHELCHTIHKNHGPKFHALLDRVSGGRHRDLDRHLKTHTPRW